MPSLADSTMRARLVVERVARAVAAMALVALLARAFFVAPGAPVRVVGVDSLPVVLKRATMFADSTRIHVRVDGDLPPAQRDWLAALSVSRPRVTWDAPGAVPSAAVADAAAIPSGATSVVAAGPRGTLVTLADDYGALDAAAAVNGGVRFLVRSAWASLRVRAGATVLRPSVPDSLTLGRILVLGVAAWESKFVIAALEEEGWRTDAIFSLGPKGAVVQDGGDRRAANWSLDTSRYSAVIVLDSSATTFAPRIADYVRRGGGLVVQARAVTLPGLVALAAGGFGSRSEGVDPFDVAAPDPRRSLSLTPISLTPDVVPLERRDSLVAVAARRVERGRVVVFGYDDTWRWRMAGGDSGVAAHRQWWVDLVAAVAYTGRTPRAITGPIDEAPFAHLVDRLGPPSTAPRASLGAETRLWLFVALVLALLVEWGSRRLRGEV